MVFKDCLEFVYLAKETNQVIVYKIYYACLFMYLLVDKITVKILRKWAENWPTALTRHIEVRTIIKLSCLYPAFCNAHHLKNSFHA